MKSRKLAAVALLLVACGDGDGPAGSNQGHPVLGACTYLQTGLTYKCIEYRNITDAGWAQIDCNADSTGFKQQFVEDGTCDATKETRGVCKQTDSGGMTKTEWFYDCGSGQSSTALGDCSKQPSTIQAECQAMGGTYLPPDEAG